MYNTGYLTDGEKPAGGRHTLKIPNREVRLIFEQQILTWFSKKIKSDAGKLQSFCKAAEDGDAEKMQQIFGEYLRKSISVRDSAVRKGRKESFIMVCWLESLEAKILGLCCPIRNLVKVTAIYLLKYRKKALDV